MADSAGQSRQSISLLAQDASLIESCETASILSTFSREVESFSAGRDALLPCTFFGGLLLPRSPLT